MIVKTYNDNWPVVSKQIFCSLLFTDEENIPSLVCLYNDKDLKNLEKCNSIFHRIDSSKELSKEFATAVNEAIITRQTPCINFRWILTS